VRLATGATAHRGPTGTIMLERIDDKGAKRPKNICGTIRFTLVPTCTAAGSRVRAEASAA